MKQEYSISIEAEINSELHESLAKYLERHPYWDINRVLNASLSLFMMQNWDSDRGLEKQDRDTCTRVYLDSIFQEHRLHQRYEEKS